jgi:hypothetical protein
MTPAKALRLLARVARIARPARMPRRRGTSRRTGIGPAAIGVGALLVVGVFMAGAAPLAGDDALRPISSATEESPDPPVVATPLPAATGSPEPAPEPSPVLANREPAEPAPTSPANDAVTEALAALSTIPVKGRAPKTGYDRDEQFGSAWRDVDNNSCDTRNDILTRDLVDIVRDGACRVLTGVLVDPYSGQSIAFTRGVGTSSEVQIDHVVALLNAWETGAQQLTRDERVRFANDPRNLMAVAGRVNAQKGAGDAATWLPPQKSFRCTYVTMQIEVKVDYRLWVTAAERDAMVRVLAECAS